MYRTKKQNNISRFQSATLKELKQEEEEEKKDKQQLDCAYFCQTLEFSIKASMVERRNDQEDTTAVINIAEGLTATTYKK